MDEFWREFNVNELELKQIMYCIFQVLFIDAFLQQTVQFC